MHNTTVKRFFKTAGVLLGLAFLAVLVMVAILPWMDRTLYESSHRA